MSLDHDVQKAVIVSHTGLDPDVGSMKLALFTPEDVPIELPSVAEVFVFGTDIAIPEGVPMTVLAAPYVPKITKLNGVCYLSGGFNVTGAGTIMLPLPDSVAPASPQDVVMDGYDASAGVTKPMALTLFLNSGIWTMLVSFMDGSAWDNADSFGLSGCYLAAA